MPSRASSPPDGAYCQHSANYHRLALQAAMLGACHPGANASPQSPFPPATLSRLQAGVSWLLALLDPLSGQVPNLGPNDGALIFPLAGSPFADYRPALQTAARAFFSEPALPPGPWDETSLWLGLPVEATAASEPIPSPRLAHPGQSVLKGAARLVGLPARRPLHLPPRARRPAAPRPVVAGAQPGAGSWHLPLHRRPALG